MQLVGFCVSNQPPIEVFDVDDLSSRVVIAGPNGVGKTRLTQALLKIFQSPSPDPSNWIRLRATSDEEKEIWKKAEICTSDPADCDALKRLLQTNRLRRNLRSSVVHIESNRNISKIKPFEFTWETPDPDEEKINWNITLSTLNSRWNDTQNSIFRKIFAQRNTLGSEAIKLRRQGSKVMNLHFSDPLDPFREAFESLLAPKKLIQPELESQRLMYEFNGTKLAVDTLSSGERQVVNIAFDIILRSPSDSIFVIDEPELHLHPELSFKLIRTLQGIGENNQFVFFTHSADIISSSIDDTVLFMRPPNGGANQAVKAGRDDDATQGLKLLGHSIGVISLGRKIVLIEGEDASTDKKVYSSILGNGISDFVLLPVGSVQTLHNFEKIRERILDKAIWGVDFYMVCDHDAPYHDGILADDCAHPRLKKIGRYHIENYFLEEEILAQVFEDIDTEAEWLRDPARVNSELKSLAAQKLSYATALVVARDVWSRGGNVKILPKACDGANEVQLVDLVAEMANREIARVGQLLKAEEIVALTQSTYRTLQESLEGNDWKFKIPAKSVLRAFFAKAGIKDVHVKSLYIRKAQDSKNNPFKDIVEIFEYFRTGT